MRRLWVRKSLGKSSLSLFFRGEIRFGQSHHIMSLIRTPQQHLRHCRIGRSNFHVCCYLMGGTVRIPSLLAGCSPGLLYPTDPRGHSPSSSRVPWGDSTDLWGTDAVGSLTPRARGGRRRRDRFEDYKMQAAAAELCGFCPTPRPPPPLPVGTGGLQPCGLRTQKTRCSDLNLY